MGEKFEKENERNFGNINDKSKEPNMTGATDIYMENVECTGGKLGRGKEGLELNTVDLRSKGPNRKGNPFIKEMISGLIRYCSIPFHIGHKGILVCEKS